MDPEEMFIPQGVPWEPTRTPIVRPPAPAMAPPPSAGQTPPKMDGTTSTTADDGMLHPVLLSNQVDEFGIVTVSLLKPSLEVDLGIRLKRVVGRGLLLDEFYHSTSLLHGTHLVADMKVLFINGCDCAELLVSEAMLMISSTVGEVTLVAAHQQVLFSAQATGTATATPATAQSTALVVSGATASSSSYALPSVAQSSTSSTAALVAGQTPTPQHSIQSAAAAAAGTTTSTNTTTAAPRAASPARSTKSTTSTTPSSSQRVKVVIHKPTKRSAVGLVIMDEPLLNGNAKTAPTIAKIEPQSLCDGTALKIGMRIRSVNGLQCYKKGDTMTKLKRAKATVYIEAEQLPQAPEEQAQKDEIVQDDASSASRPRRFSWFSSRRLTTKRHDNYHATVRATTATAGPMISRSNSGEMA